MDHRDDIRVKGRPSVDGPTEIRLGLGRKDGDPDEIRKSPNPIPRYESQVTIWDRVGAIFVDVGDFAMEKKHDIWSTLAGAVPGLLLIVLEATDALPDPWSTYIMAAGLIVLGILTNSWTRLFEFLPELIEKVVEQFTGSKKSDTADPDEDELDEAFGKTPTRG